MMTSLQRLVRGPGVGLMLAVLVAAILPGSTWAQDDNADLESLLREVGAEYAESYAAPFVHTFGPNLNSNLFSTAAIPWAGLTFGVGFKMTAASLNEDDQTFRRVVDGVEFDNYIAADNPYYDDLHGRTGSLVMSGPTIFGDTETTGKIRFYSDGLMLAEMDGITGLVDTRFVPTPIPEAYVGGFFGLKATVRWMPEIDLSDYGKVTFKGFGLQWSANGLVPDLPIDVMAGFSKQKLEVGDLLETNADSYFIGASKGFTMLTVYTGVSVESSDMTVTYTFDELDQDIEIEVEGVQDNRGVLGGTLNLGLAKLNAEVAKGKIATYSMGLMFGL